jgi:hypothetical protein
LGSRCRFHSAGGMGNEGKRMICGNIPQMEILKHA